MLNVIVRGGSVTDVFSTQAEVSYENCVRVLDRDQKEDLEAIIVTHPDGSKSMFTANVSYITFTDYETLAFADIKLQEEGVNNE